MTALMATMALEPDMVSAAISGRRTSPKSGANRLAALLNQFVGCAAEPRTTFPSVRRGQEELRGRHTRSGCGCLFACSTAWVPRPGRCTVSSQQPAQTKGGRCVPDEKPESDGR